MFPAFPAISTQGWRPASEGLQPCRFLPTASLGRVCSLSDRNYEGFGWRGWGKSAVRRDNSRRNSDNPDPGTGGDGRNNCFLGPRENGGGSTASDEDGGNGYFPTTPGGGANRSGAGSVPRPAADDGNSDGKVDGPTSSAGNATAGGRNCQAPGSLWSNPGHGPPGPETTRRRGRPLRTLFSCLSPPGDFPERGFYRIRPGKGEIVKGNAREKIPAPWQREGKKAIFS